MKVPVGFNWLIAGISFIEARIEKSLTFLAEKKELVLIPFICNFWPCWLTPNRITAFRLLISLAIIFWLILKGAPLYQNNYWLAIVVIIACLTDLFDGPVARAMKKESKIGSLFDKIVDKFLILPLGIVQFWTLDSLLVVLS